MNTSAFFTSVRKSLFKGKLTASQVSGMERLIDAWDRYGFGGIDGAAYTLAVSYHETGRRMQPVREGYASSTKQAIAILDKAFLAGKLTWVKTPYWREGWFGRGDVQLTHKANYAGKLRTAVKKVFGVDILVDPDLVLRPDISAYILVEGMTRGDTGTSDFTKFDLESFLLEKKTPDFKNARKTVNPGEKDSYALIAGYAEKFKAALLAAGYATPAKDTKPAKAPAPAKAAPKIDIYDGGFHEEVRQLQTLLDAKGWPEVGDLDGKYGDKTATAIMSAKRFFEITPINDKITDDLLAALARSAGREIGKQRANATVADVAKVSPIVKPAEDTKTFGQWVIGLGTAAGLGKGGLDIADTTEKLTSLQGLLDVAKGMLPFLLLAGVGGAVFYFGRKILRREVESYREGRRV